VTGDGLAHVVRVEPVGSELVVAAEESVMAAATRAHHTWPSVCGGNAQCSVCFVKVLAGVENLEPPSEVERAALKQLRGVVADARPEIRLACQLRVRGDATVRKPGVKPQPICR
jgi:2Fe-2S ferredoxin